MMDSVPKNGVRVHTKEYAQKMRSLSIHYPMWDGTRQSDSSLPDCRSSLLVRTILLMNSRSETKNFRSKLSNGGHIITMARYQITEETAHGTTAYHLTDNLRRAEAVLYPALGNNCVIFRTTPDGAEPSSSTARADADVVDIFMPPDNIDDLRRVPFHGGQPILFPFPNRVRDGVYTFEGTTHSMEKLLATGWDRGAGQAIHGLVADKAWTVEDSEADDSEAYIRCSLQLDAFPDIVEQYPYPCRLTVTYILSEGVLEMRTEVVNTGTKTLPMGFGIHPWFAAALRPGLSMPEGLKKISNESRVAALVHVPANSIWELEKLMPTGKVVPVEQAGTQFDLREFAPLADHFFDHVFTGVIRRSDGWSEGGLRDTETGLEMYIAADSAFREWVLYAPKTLPVIALEPYTCTTDAVNLQPKGIDAGLIALPAGQTWRGDIRFGLRRFA